MKENEMPAWLEKEYEKKNFFFFFLKLLKDKPLSRHEISMFLTGFYVGFEKCYELLEPKINELVKALDDWLDFKPDHFSKGEEICRYTARKALKEFRGLGK